MNKRIKYLIGFIIIVGALGYLMMTSFKSSLQYYITVSEALAAEQNYYADKILKLAGKAENIQRIEDSQKPLYEFLITEAGQSIKVSYSGFVPDTFKEGSDVVVTGTLENKELFKATHILAKCSSKYQAKTN